MLNFDKAVFFKTMGNNETHRDIKLVATDRRKTFSVLEPNYHTTKSFSSFPE